MLYPEVQDLIGLRAVVQRMELLARNRYDQSSGGNYASIFRGLGVEFETVRPYVVGDDVRYIDWRVTARVGKAHIKTYRAECDRNVVVAVDCNAYMRFGTRSTFKSVQAARIAAFFLWHCLQQQDRVGGMIFGDVAKGVEYFAPTKNVQTTLQMLKALSRKEIDVHSAVSVQVGLQDLARVVVPQSLVFVVADFGFAERADLEQRLIALRCRCNVVLVAIFDPADQDIPAVGRLGFMDGESRLEIDTNDTRARKQYQQAWQDYQQWLIKLGKKYKIPVLWLSTGQDCVKYCMHALGILQAWKS